MGGTWVSQSKDRPGLYINFKSKEASVGSMGERGILAVPAALSWGNPNGLIVLNAETYLDKALALIGYRATDDRVRHITAAMGHASKILLYRLSAKGGVKAKATAGTLTATAKYEGVRGNDLKIIIEANVDVAGSFDVKTLLESEEVDSQMVATADKLISNDFVVFSGTGALTANAGVSLTGGTAGTGGNGEYAEAFTAFEVEDFNVLTVPTDDSSIKQLAVAYTKRLRDSEGKKMQTVLYNHPGADHEGVINLKNSIIASDGMKVDPLHMLWEIAAMEAAANVDDSLTYTVIPDAVDVFPKYTSTEIGQALKNGELVLSVVNGEVRIEQDVNSLKTFTSDKGKQFRKNRIVRVLDSIANDLQRIFSTSYIGKVSNNAEGRNLFKAEIINYMTTLQGLGAVQNFNSQTDIVIVQGNDSDAVVVNLAIQPVDSIEKIYMTVTVK